MSTRARSTADQIEVAAQAVAAQYGRVSARETDVAIALLTLWTLDALEAGHLSDEDASTIFTSAWVGITDQQDGPDLAEATDELLFEGGWLHDGPIGEAPDHGHLRQLALGILDAQAGAR